jgi:hypothetical protein
MAVAKVKGRLKGKQPKLSKTQRKHRLTLHDAGGHTQAQLAELFQVSRTKSTASSNGAPPEARQGLTAKNVT